MRAQAWIPLATVLAVAAASAVHPWGDLRRPVSRADGAILPGALASVEVRSALVQKCGDCHSNATRWPLYSRVAPSSWLVEHDVHAGRQHMNLSTWEQYSLDERIDLLGKMSSQMRQAKMPLKPYLLLHPDARLSDSERKLLVDWAKAERKRLMAEAAK
jgi:cytochrome c